MEQNAVFEEFCRFPLSSTAASPMRRRTGFPFNPNRVVSLLLEAYFVETLCRRKLEK